MFGLSFFAFGNSQGGPLSGTFVEFTDTFTTGHLKADVSGRTMTVTVTPTGEAARILTHVFTTDTGGTGVGIGLFGDSRIDNVGIGGAVASPAPEPASWAMMVGGFGAIGAAMRRRRRVAVRFA